MLRILWGESLKEKLQQEEIARLRAQISDLQHNLVTQAEAHRLTMSETYKAFLGFLRPAAITPDIYHSPTTELPGIRTDTSPPYPEKPLWARSEIKTAGGD